MSTPKPAPAAAVAALPAVGHYGIDAARSSIEFSARHMFGLGGVTGSFRIREGELTVGDTPAATSMRAVVDAASFASGDARRDAHVRAAKFLDVATHPDIVFTADRVRDTGDGLVADGSLTVQGRSTPVEVHLSETSDGDGSPTLVAHTRIDRRAHGITAARGLAGRYLDLTITAVTTSA